MNTVISSTESSVRVSVRRRELAFITALLLVVATIVATAMLRTSTTFDEIVMVAGGARGFETGEWLIAPEHPPLTQYLYGLPVFLSDPVFPDESRLPEAAKQDRGYRYLYAQHFFWRSGNDPERLALLGRLPAVAAALLLIVATWIAARGAAGPAAGILAATFTAFTPDVLAHGGVAYNDIPVAAAMLIALFAADRALRDPSVRSGVLAGVLIAIALATKNSALALAPMIGLLLVAEAAIRKGDRNWSRRLVTAGGVLLVACYVALALIYRGDLTLLEYRYSIAFALQHVEGNVPAYLLGTHSMNGFWYFFPVAFLFKTSAAYHLLLLIAAVTMLRTLRAGAWIRRMLASALRVPLAGLAVFGVLLLTSELNIGFRYALPALPMLAILVAAGVVRFWDGARGRSRTLVAAVVIWTVAHPLSYYPHFLTYISEYGPGRDESYKVLVDSSLDWGQGLLELRSLMQEEGIERVRLSYFGSAMPAGYGITYDPLPSFFPLPGMAGSDTLPTSPWIAVSATNLAGVYLTGDPFSALRQHQPTHIVANSIYLYRVSE